MTLRTHLKDLGKRWGNGWFQRPLTTDDDPADADPDRDTNVSDAAASTSRGLLLAHGGHCDEAYESVPTPGEDLTHK